MRVSIMHLQRSKKSGLLSYRRRFPDDLVELIPGRGPAGKGRRELKVSLRSSDINDPQARLRFAEAEAEYDKIVARARRLRDKSFDPLDPALIAYLAERYTHEHLELDEAMRWKRRPLTSPAFVSRGHAEEVYEECREMLEERASDALVTYWRGWAVDYAEALGFLLDPRDAQMPNLCRALGEAACQVWLAIDQRLDGDDAGTPSAPEAPPRKAAGLSVAQGAREHLSIFDLFDRYSGVPGRNLKTVRQWRRYIEHLAHFLGTENVYEMSHDDMVAWRNHLRDEVTYKGRRLSAKTINGSYLGSVGALFAWAKGDGLIPVNHMAEVARVSLPRQPRTRGKGFTNEEAVTILAATTNPISSREGQSLRDAKRWCPWLMAYSGARVNEITQLRREDIFERDGIWVMHITPEAGTVKSKRDRLVPLHSHLLDQGFLQFVEGTKSGPLFYDPSRRRSDNAINRQSNRLGSKLADWVKSLGVVGVKPNHAWRHYFSSMAVRYELDPRVTKAIVGHSSSDVHDKTYLEGLRDQVDLLKREIEKIPRFEVT